MQPFLKLVANYVFEHYKDNVENLYLVVPSKRAALFLKNHLYNSFNSAFWIPEVKSAEEFIEDLSGLNKADEIDLLAILYESYLHCNTNNPESFDKFSRWGYLLLQDFNEIDRYLIDSKHIYENLKNIKEIENWSLGDNELTPTQLNYLEFMGNIGKIYLHYTERLLSLNIGYQGLIYRSAVKSFENHPLINGYHKIIFCGFNALNAAETKIYTSLQKSKKADFLWDIDEYYFKNEKQEAGLFLRRNLQSFSSNNLSFVNAHYKQAKEIFVTAVAGQTGQAQLVHNEIQNLINAGVNLSKVAVVLANENLLWPVLKLLPKDVKEVNITMEYPLRYTPIYGFLELLINLQVSFTNANNKTGAIYYKDFLSIIRNSFFATVLKIYQANFDINQAVTKIGEGNIIYLSPGSITKLTNCNNAELLNLFSPWKNTQQGNEVLLQLVKASREYFVHQENSIVHSLEVEHLEVITKSFYRLQEVLHQYTYFNELKSYKYLFMQTVGAASVPFIGEPLTGLQIMGVLETRTLDFEYLIMVGVNEGVLPSGKSMNSFLPNDLKRVFGLPLYYEKDAIYAYHFYRLLQRAHTIHLIHDSQTDEMGKGERSRFITQLMFELKLYESSHKITENAAASVSEGIGNAEIVIVKTEEVLMPIIKKATDNTDFGGLSPSALLTFKDCSLRYYFRYAAGLKETIEVEESAEANTFGTILHLSLENLYKPLIGKNLIANDIKERKKLVDEIVEAAFKEHYKEEDSIIGKNYLQYEVLKVYATRQLDRDIENIKALAEQNKQLSIIALESKWLAEIELQLNGETKKIVIRGTVDRLDRFGENIRVIDYKNSVKSNDKFKFTSFADLFTDSDYNKQFQLLMYTWLIYKNKPEFLPNLLPGIIAFKDYSNHPHYLRTEGKGATSYLTLNEVFMQEFETELIHFIQKIF
ncbi:MAG: PD-(D/E)XK nuclease family protein, partial [Bacteroidia bacterium]|nr:PD-(D/E)XK nuclease family protein [Bacteroidia bacterium]